MKIFFVLIFCVSISIITNAQTGAVSGRITDNSNDDPLEYASVAVYKTTDSSLVTGVITNRSGNFKIEKLNPGSYFIRAQFLGYESRSNQFYPDDK